MSFRLTPKAAQGLEFRSVAASPVQAEMVAVYTLGELSRSRSVNHINFISGEVVHQPSNYEHSDAICHNDYLCQEERKNLFSMSRLSFASMARGTGLETKSSIKSTKKSIRRANSAKSSNPTYTLKSFLKDFQKRESNEDLIADLDFSDKHALSWNTGTNMSGMLRGDISDGAAYQCKFENWAKGVISREKKKLHDDTSINQFSVVRNSWPAGSNRSIITEVKIFLQSV
jgi:hypothetical protein